MAAVPRATQHAAIRISELEKALLAIRQARDATLSQIYSLTSRLKAEEDRGAELTLVQESMVCAAERSQAALEAATRESEELRGLLRTKDEDHLVAMAELKAQQSKAPEPAGESLAEKHLASQLAAARKKITRLEERLQKAEERHRESLAEFATQLAAADREKRSAEGTTEKARQQLELSTREREQLSKDVEAREHQHAAEVADLEARLLEAQSNPAEKRLLEELAAAQRKISAVDAYFEKAQAQQKQANSTLVEKCVKANQERRAAEVAAKQARKELEESTSQQVWLRQDLEEARAEVARLQTRVARAAIESDASAELEQQRHQITELSAQLDSTRDELRLAWALKKESAEPVADAPAPAEPLMTDETIPAPLEGSAALAAIENLRAILGVAVTLVDPAEALALLHAQIQDFSQRTLCAGSMATYRIIGVCGEVVQWMLKAPQKIGLMHDILQEAFRCLTNLADTGGAAEADTDGTTVYVVDDDVDNCECIAMALDKIGLRTHYASNPKMAVQLLQTQAQDLIILDVDLGTADGFEVHEQLRQVPHLRQTPILFCSGLSGADTRTEELGDPQVGFISKPYTLLGLSLKALAMVINARLA